MAGQGDRAMTCSTEFIQVLSPVSSAASAETLAHLQSSSPASTYTARAGVSSEGKISVLKISDKSRRQGMDWAVEATEQSLGYVLTRCLGMGPDEVTNTQVEFQKTPYESIFWQLHHYLVHAER